MSKRIRAFALIFILLLTHFTAASAATLGPASSYSELLKLLSAARGGDTLLISGKIDAGSEALTTDVSIHIQSADETAEICGLQIQDASVAFKDIHLSDVQISGTSNVMLGSGVRVYGSEGQSALDFCGNGTLIVERGCFIQGGSGSSGISIAHSSGDFYGSIEGSVSGGDGKSGGAGMVVSPLGDAGAIMISGSIRGGSGDSLGGHALNLYDLSGNAYITVDGTLQGGSGSIGGDGIQLVSANDSVNVGISGQIRGGSGESYGGSALILMNPADSSSFHLSGSFSGGDALNAGAQPGTSLQLVGDAAVLRARINDCILEDGRKYEAAEEPTVPVVTPLPEIPDDSKAEETLSESTPAPEQTPSSDPESIPSDTPDGIVSDSSPNPPAEEPDAVPADPPTEQPEEESAASSDVNPLPDEAPDAESETPIAPDTAPETAENPNTAG